MGNPFIRYEKRGHKAYITLNRPSQMNAISFEMAQELANAWQDIKLDRNVWVVILTGAGKEAFTIGLETSVSLAALDPNAAHSLSVDDMPVNRTTARRNQVWKPVIAAINGICAAPGGLTLLMDSDIAICSENATFFDHHLNTGRVIATESIGLARRIGFAHTMRLILLGRSGAIDAKRAYEMGLVEEVLPQKKLLQRADELADLVLESAPLAVQGSVQAMWKALDIGGRQAATDMALQFSRRNAFTKDYKAGMRAFSAGKRPLKWKGE